MRRFAAGSGLRVITLPQPHLHRTALVYAVRVGPRFERRETAGLSHFLEHMLHRGTERHPSAHDQAVALDEIGASLDAATGIDHGTMTLSCPPEHFAEAATLLGEIAARPAFSDIDVERGIVREELLEERDDRGRNVDPDTALRSALFADHPLSLPIVGTLGTLASFDERALARHHARHYTNVSAVVAIAGKLTTPLRTQRALDRAFGSHRAGRPIRARAFRRAAAASRLRAVRTSTSQVSIRVGCLGPGRSDPLEAATDLLLRVVDDGTSTRLYERLCDRLGLCYEVSAAWEPYDDVGLFDVAAEVEEPAAPRVVEEILGLLGDLARLGPTRAEVERAIGRARWYAEKSQDQPETTAEELAMSTLAGETRTPFDRYRRLVRLRPADVRAAAARTFDPRRVAVALVGPVTARTERRVRAMLA